MRNRTLLYAIGLCLALGVTDACATDATPGGGHEPNSIRRAPRVLVSMISVFGAGRQFRRSNSGAFVRLDREQRGAYPRIADLGDDAPLPRRAWLSGNSRRAVRIGCRRELIKAEACWTELSHKLCGSSAKPCLSFSESGMRGIPFQVGRTRGLPAAWSERREGMWLRHSGSFETFCAKRET